MKEIEKMMESGSQPLNAPDFSFDDAERMSELVLQSAKDFAAIEEAVISDPAEPTFENTVAPYVKAVEEYNSSAFFSGYLACADRITYSPEIFGCIVNEKRTAAFRDRVNRLYQRRDSLSLDAEDAALLERLHSLINKGGYMYTDEQQRRQTDLRTEISQLADKMRSNISAARKAAAVIVPDLSCLEDMPDNLVRMAADEARSRGIEGYAFVPTPAVRGNFISHCVDESMRKRMYDAGAALCNGGEFDNTEIINRITELYKEIAGINGCDSYDGFSVMDMSLDTPGKVKEFLKSLEGPALDAARKEDDYLWGKARLRGHDLGERSPWNSDRAYRLNVIDGEKNSGNLKDYLDLEGCLDAFFKLAGGMFGITFERREDISLPKGADRAYAVFEEDGRILGFLYMDLYQSDATSVGAYTMPVIRPHSEDGRRHPGSVMVKTNFMKEDGRPCQLRFNELKTLFHELGHALHDLFQDTRYRYMLAPHNDDCRELPSMFMEKWASVPEVIVPFARHCQTGEPMPESLVRRLKSLSGPDPLMTLSSVGKSLLDMEWYSGRDHSGESLVEMEKRTSVYYREFEGEDACISTTFTHIFGGGYAGQYFVYLWSDVISADAYAVFKEENSLRETGERFRREFLSKGSATRSLRLYENFAGHAPGTGPFVGRLQSRSCD